MAYVPTSHHLDARVEFIAKLLEGPDDMLLRTPEAAALLGMSQQWLETGRSSGYGPKFTRIGSRSVAYQMGDLRAYLKERSRYRCTSEYPKKKRRVA